MLLLTTTILQCPSERSNELISLWSKCNALRTIYRPSESISPKDFRFCFVVPAQRSNPLRVLSKTQPGWIMNIPAVGLIGSPPIILAIGHCLWVIGYGLEYAACRYPCLYALRPTLYTKSDSDHASNLSPYRLIVHTFTL